LYLGIDFWRQYDLLPKSLSIEEVVVSNEKASDIRSEDTHVLSDVQRAKLSNVINCFPSFTQEGLGKTSLITHSIDVGDAKPIKQRHFPVSPAVERAMYTKIDRMLKLGVIEESQSAWSIPIVMVIKPGKIRIFMPFGFCNATSTIIGDGGLRTDPEKVAAISNFPVPKTLRGLRSFMGLCCWYRKFVPNFAALSAPLTDLMTTKRKFTLTPEAMTAFHELKKCLTEAPVLCNPDFSKPFSIHCDASKTGVGAVLVQVSEEGD
ncbi:hypothetical protein KR054_011785, partial [Drosophila jambulina]